MKRILLGLALGTAAMLPAFAQTTPTPSPTTNPPVVNAPGTRHDSTTGANSATPAVQTDSSRQNASAPVPGANSFTESQARSRIEGAGFSSVTGLHKDNQGIWRGRGMHAGAAVDVTLDYQGNVTGH
jgi:putative membrane protein